MGMRKSYNKLVVASTVAMIAGFAGNAQALVNMDLNTGSINFASEATVSAAGTQVNTGNTAILDAETTFGFSIGEGTSKYVRFDFVNTTVSSSILPTDFAITSGAVVNVSISTGGSIGDNFVIVEVAAVTGDINQDDSITFAPAASRFQVTDKSTATITYTLYEFAAHALSGDYPLAQNSATFFSWATGLNAQCTPLNASKIDVVDRNTK